MRRGGVLAAGAAVLTVAVAVAASLGLGGARGEGADGGGVDVAPVTAPVTRQTLVRTVTLAGDLDYGATTPLAVAAEGTVTWLAPVGVTVRRGDPLLRVDERPVLLLYGAVPMYRALAAGATGADVAQFERNLAALGYTGLTVDDTFSAATAAAVKRWQRDLGLPETGTVERERVVYAPGAVRIGEHRVRVGAAATGEVLGYTGSTKVVTVQAQAGQVGWATRGAAVTVVLPGGVTLAGKVDRVGAEALPASGGQEGEPASPGTGGATVAVTVTIADQRAVAKIERSPVDVRYVAERRADALTVPVGALLALAEGGYGVEIVSGGGARTVAVETGLFSDGRVEVRGPDLAEGVLVAVPQ
ncbi:peptidoglycan-binding protein [Rhizomonospora bruguierae]|uniref:peptidoglycan-binding protein n=1 Tax=Rhizomonospora bruguierae TaxID=1581705 RepID=UPI001BD0B1A6|nr:peptidoglycan-binding protein [Micromonospora sp. NBRC 107566]